MMVVMKTKSLRFTNNKTKGNEELRSLNEVSSISIFCQMKGMSFVTALC